MRTCMAMFLAGCLCVLLCVPVIAAAPRRIQSLHPSFAQQVSVCLDGEPLDVSDLDDLTVSPGGEISIVLSGPDGMPLFFDQDGSPVATADVTVSKMRAAEVSVLKTLVHGVDVVEDVEINVLHAGTLMARPVALIRMKPELSDVDGLPFAFDIILSIGGLWQEQTKMTFSGTFANPEFVLSAFDTDADCSDGKVLVVPENIPKITLDAGCGVFLDASLESGQRCRAVAEQSSDAQDISLMRQHPALLSILILSVNGFADDSIKGVSIDMPQAMYVYSGQGVFLGMTTERLPIEEKYYVSARRIEFRY